MSFDTIDARKPKTISGSAVEYKTAIEDVNMVLRINKTISSKVTIRKDRFVPVNPGRSLKIINLGSGTLTIEGESGVTINGNSPFELDQYQEVEIYNAGTNVWDYGSTSSDAVGLDAAGVRAIPMTGFTESTIDSIDDFDPEDADNKPSATDTLLQMLMKIWMFLKYILWRIGFFPNYFNVKFYGAKGDGVTDDSTAIQATMNACAASLKGQVVYFPDGHYIASNELPDWADVTGTNPACQLYIPLFLGGGIPGNQYARFELIGESHTRTQTLAGSMKPKAGVLIESTVTGVASGGGTCPSVIGSQYYWDGTAERNEVSVRIHNIQVRVHAGTDLAPLPVTLNGFDMEPARQVDVGKIFVDSNINYFYGVAPTVSAYAFKFPNYGNNGLQKIDRLMSYGMPLGVKLQEHAYIDHLMFVYGSTAVNISNNGHMMGINRLTVEMCQTSINLGNVDAILHVNEYETEHNHAGQTESRYFTFAYDVYQPGASNGRVTIDQARIVVGASTGGEYRLYTNTPYRVSVGTMNNIRVGETLIETDAASVQLDGIGQNCYNFYAASGNKTVTVVNEHHGAKYRVVVWQDAVGGRTVTWPANSVITPPPGVVLSTAANTGTMYEGIHFLSPIATILWKAIPINY